MLYLAFMKSIVEFIYPQVVWRDGEKLLWNSIHRKALKNRPEERVRLRTIEYLISAGWSKHRISTEESIGQFANSAMRTDIICYNQQFDPVILIECKAEHISISSKTAEQTARYNQKVGAPYLMMTNGLTDFWYEIRNDGINELEQKPSFLDKDFQIPCYRFEDWKNRGFAGSKAVPDLRKWMEELLPEIWFKRETIRFLNFNQSLTDLDLNHYYCLKLVSDDRKIAVTAVSTPFRGSRFIAILNQARQNKAVLEINLDLLFDKQKGNSSIYSEAGVSTFDLYSYFDLKQAKDVDTIFRSLNEVFEDVIEM